MSVDLICKPLLTSGTTLDLLKFPLLNPTPERLYRRRQRLEQEAKWTEKELSEEEQRRLRLLSKKGYLLGK